MSHQQLPKDVNAERELTPRQLEIAEHILTTGQSPYAASEALGTTPRNIYRTLAYPHVKRYLQERMREHIGLLSITAMRVQGELLQADSEHVRAAVSTDILNRHLGKPVERKQVHHQGGISVSIDLG